MAYRSRRRPAKLLILGTLFVLGAAWLCTGRGDPVRRVPNAKVIEIDPSKGYQIRPALAKNTPGEGEAFGSMVARLRPYAAINGTFYDENLRPLGDILIDGKLANRGVYRNALAVKHDGKIHFVHRQRGRLRWAGYAAGLAAGPRLVHRGHVALDPVADGFSRRSLRLKAYRSGLGLTRSGSLLMVVTEKPVTLDEFARMMTSLGAAEAMNLDGGGACGLYCQGRSLVVPGLPMTNILAVYEK